MSNPLRWVFGLSLDEKAAWALAEVNPRQSARGEVAYPGRFHWGTIANLPNGHITSEAFPIEEIVCECVRRLRQKPELAHALNQIDFVGISTVGVVDRHNKLLTRLTRKNWKHNSPKGVIDFRKLISRVFPDHGEDFTAQRLNVHNDATAKCLAQICWSKDIPRGAVCYLNADYGINIGFANRLGPLSAAHVHPEAGHIYPSLMRIDQENKGLLTLHSGCPTHLFCYEGVASRSRLENQWKNISLKRLHTHDDQPMERIAFYLGQLCWSVAVAAAVDQILLAGSLIGYGIEERIIEHFSRFNRGAVEGQVGREPYIASSVLRQDFITLARALPVKVKLDHSSQAGGLDDPSQIDGLMGALELARLGLRKAKA